MSLVLLTVHAALALLGCESYCKDASCSQLNGDVSGECGQCASDHACHPGAEDFGPAAPRGSAPEARENVVVRNDGGIESSSEAIHAEAKPGEYSHGEADPDAGCPAVGASLGIDRAVFEAEYCTNMSARAESGVAVLRGALNAEELATIRDSTSVRHIPYPARYMCGQSDDQVWTPDECILEARWLVRTFPRFFKEEVAGKLQRWVKPGGEIEFLRINGPRAPGRKVELRYSVLQKLLFESQEAISQSKSLLSIERTFSQLTGEPFYSGWHGWHRDRPGSGVDKLWVMLWREDAQSNEHTGLKVVPHDAILRYTTPECVRSSLSPHLGRDDLLDQMKCDVKVAPGDAVYYSSHVYHGSQDAKQDRESISLDLLRRQPADGEYDRHVRHSQGSMSSAR